jgi:hypothetical protein
MKRIISALIISSAFGVLIALAATTPTPTIDEAKTPVDADRTTISGMTEPGSIITISGGAAPIGPSAADGEGIFSITVELTQETTNVFRVYSTDGDDERSEEVEVTIVEGVEVTREYEEDRGVDHSAPAEPVLEEEEATVVDGETYDIEGSGEAGAYVLVNGDTMGSVTDDGNFDVEVEISNNGITDFFYVSLKDGSGNISGTSLIEVTGLLITEEEPVEEEPAEEELEDDDGIEDVFPDVANHWAKDYIDALYNLRDDQGIIQGFPDGFRPDEPITRGALLKIALLAFEVNVDDAEVSAVRPFEDVPRDDWTALYVDRGYELEIIEGELDEDGEGRNFHPRRYISRAAAVKIILESAGVTNREDFIDFFETVGEADSFPDIERGAWFRHYALYARHKGWMQGDQGEFRASRYITRGEVAKIVMEVAEWLDGEGSDTPPVEERDV